MTNHLTKLLPILALLFAANAFASDTIKATLSEVCHVAGRNELTVITQAGKVKGSCSSSRQDGISLFVGEKQQFIDRTSILRVEFRVRKHTWARTKDFAGNALFAIGFGPPWAFALFPVLGGYVVVAAPVCLTIDLFSKLRGATIIDIT
jgi:hypothetical protein